MVKTSVLQNGLFLCMLLFAAESRPQSLQSVPQMQELQDPAIWLIDGASYSVHNLGEGGEEPLFRLDVGEFESVAGTGSTMVIVPTASQKMLEWSGSLVEAIRCGEIITFSVGTETFTASRQDTVDQGACDMTKSRYFWTGTINESKGDLTCRLSWGALDITIHAMDDDVDSFYRVTVAETEFVVKRTLKTDIPKIGDGDRRRGLGDVKSHAEGRRLVETPAGAARGTDLVVFYTDSAAFSAGGSRLLESEIEGKVDEHNIAVGAVTYTQLEVNLVSMIAISSGDYSFITPSLMRDFAEQQLGAFGTELDLTNWRDLVKADAMMLIHDWSLSSDYCGIGYVEGSITMVSSNCFDRQVLQHELGHNFGLNHIDSATYATYTTIMNDGTTILEIKNEFSPTSLNILRGTSVYQVWGEEESAGATRIAPAYVGSLDTWSYVHCFYTSVGFSGLTLSRYLGTDGRDYYNFDVDCGPVSAPLDLSPLGSTLQTSETISCSSGSINGLVLYRYQNGDLVTGYQDLYTLGINCLSDGEGWKYTSYPGGVLVSSDFTYSDVEGKEDLAYLKVNRYFQITGSYDTYTFDVAFR